MPNSLSKQAVLLKLFWLPGNNTAKMPERSYIRNWGMRELNELALCLYL